MTAALAHEVIRLGPARDQGAFLTLLVMAHEADEHGVCSETTAALAAASRQPEPAVRSALRRLRAAGWLVLEASAEGRPARYRVVLAGAPGKARARRDELDPWPEGVGDPWPEGVPDLNARAG